MASPSHPMPNLSNQQSGGDEGDLEDGEIFDDEEDTPIPPAPVGAAGSPAPPPPPSISIVEDKKKLNDIRKGLPPRPRRNKRPREDDRPLKSNKQRRRSEESEKSRDKDDSDDDEMRELSPLRLGMDWDRGHHRPIFPDELDDDDDDDLLRRGRGFGSRTRRGRTGRGGRRGIGRRENSQICKFYLQGKCQRGTECPFTHSQRKYEVCKFYMNDCCAKKDRCLFLHSEFPCKYHFLGMKCYAGKKCKFSHGKISSQLRANLLRDSKECDFLQHMDSGAVKEEGGRSRREREREREHRERDRGREKDRGKERDREKKEDKDRFTLHFKVDPRTISDEEDGNRTPMPSPSPDSSSDRGTHSPERNDRQPQSPKEETPPPEPKDNGISEELPDFIPPDLPKHQRELYRRIQQQQREVKSVKTEEEEAEKESEDYKEEDWYSSEEEEGGKKIEPLTVLLNKLKEQPSRQPASPPPAPAPPQILVPPILPDIDISAVSKLLSTVRETIQQKQQKSEGGSMTVDGRPVGATPLASAPVLIPPIIPPPAPLIPPTLNPLPPLASLISESAPPPEKRRMRDPRLRTSSTEDDVDLRMGPRADVDLRQLPFKPAPVHTPANEIDASVTSHPPILYRLIPISPPPPPDYTNVHSKNVNDPRLKRPHPDSLPKAGVRDPRQRSMAANDPRRKSSLLLQRDSDLRQPLHNFSLVNDVDLRMHPPPPHLAFK